MDNQKNYAKNDIQIFKDLGFEIYRDFSKPVQKGYLLYCRENETYIGGLSNFDLYDYLREFKTEELINILLKGLTPRKLDYNMEELEQDVTKAQDFQKELKKVANFNQELSVVKSKLDKFKDSDEIKVELINSHDFYYNIFKDIVNLNKVIINDIDYKPVDERIIYSKGFRYLNKYVKNNLFKNIKPNPLAKFPHVETIVKNICGTDEAYIYFNNFMAYKLQFPLEVLPCHFVIRDDGGTGKSELLLGDILEKLFETEVITQTDLMGEFNSFMVGSNLVWCEEVEGFEDEKRLKALTGAKWINLNEKYEKTKKIRNYNNFIIGSNELRVMKITEKDRRWSIIGGGKRLVPLNPSEWDKTLFESKEGNEKFFLGYHKHLNQELKNYYSYLISLDVNRNLVQIPLRNELKKELIDMNKSSEISYIDEVIEFGITDMVKECYPLKANTILNDFIIYKGSEESILEGYWVKMQDFYNLYLQYCILNQYHKKLSKKIFIKRLENYKLFNEYFIDYRILRIDEETHRCLKLNTYKDSTLEPIDIEITELN